MKMNKINKMLVPTIILAYALSTTGCAVSGQGIKNGASNIYNKTSTSISKGIESITPESNFLGGKDSGLTYSIKNQMTEVTPYHTDKQVLSTGNMANHMLEVKAKNPNVGKLELLIPKVARTMQKEQNIDRAIGFGTDVVRYIGISVIANKISGSSSSSTSNPISNIVSGGNSSKIIYSPIK